MMSMLLVAGCPSSRATGHGITTPRATAIAVAPGHVWVSLSRIHYTEYGVRDENMSTRLGIESSSEHAELGIDQREPAGTVALDLETGSCTFDPASPKHASPPGPWLAPVPLDKKKPVTTPSGLTLTLSKAGVVATDASGASRLAVKTSGEGATWFPGTDLVFVGVSLYDVVDGESWLTSSDKVANVDDGLFAVTPYGVLELSRSPHTARALHVPQGTQGLELQKLTYNDPKYVLDGFDGHTLVFHRRSPGFGDRTAALWTFDTATRTWHAVHYLACAGLPPDLPANDPFSDTVR